MLLGTGVLLPTITHKPQQYTYIYTKMRLKTDRETSSTSTFSMSLATLERIDSLLIDLHSYWQQGDVLLIQRVIFSVYKELYPFLNIKERKEGDKFTDNIRESLGFDIGSQSFTYSVGITKTLNDFDFWLRDMLHKKGLLMAKPDNPEFAISQA